MLKVTLKFRKKPSVNKIYMYYVITKLFQSQSLWHAFYLHNVLWLFTMCMGKLVGSQFGQAKIRTGKFRPGITFTICTN